MSIKPMTELDREIGRIYDQASKSRKPSRPPDTADNQQDAEPQNGALFMDDAIRPDQVHAAISTDPQTARMNAEPPAQHTSPAPQNPQMGTPIMTNATTQPAPAISSRHLQLTSEYEANKADLQASGITLQDYIASATLNDSLTPASEKPPEHGFRQEYQQLAAVYLSQGIDEETYVTKVAGLAETPQRAPSRNTPIAAANWLRPESANRTISTPRRPADCTKPAAVLLRSESPSLTSSGPSKQ